MSSISASIATQVLKRHNDVKNDNTWFSGWDGKLHTAQYKLSESEAKALISDLQKMGPAYAKSVLKEIASRFGDRMGGIYAFPEAQKQLEAFAKALGLQGLSFKARNNTGVILG